MFDSVQWFLLSFVLMGYLQVDIKVRYVLKTSNNLIHLILTHLLISVGMNPSDINQVINYIKQTITIIQYIYIIVFFGAGLTVQLISM